MELHWKALHTFSWLNSSPQISDVRSDPQTLSTCSRNFATNWRINSPHHHFQMLNRFYQHRSFPRFAGLRERAAFSRPCRASIAQRCQKARSSRADWCSCQRPSQNLRRFYWGNRPRGVGGIKIDHACIRQMFPSFKKIHKPLKTLTNSTIVNSSIS